PLVTEWLRSGPVDVVAGLRQRLYHERKTPKRPGELVMLHYRFAPLALLLVSFFLLAAQEPLGKPAAPVARKVTLQTERIPLSKALEALFTQTKLPARSGLDNDPELKLNLKDASYWQALDTIAQAAGARINLYGGDGGPVLVKDTKTNRDPKLPI